MEGIIKSIDYENLIVEIVSSDVQDAVYFKFNTFEELKLHEEDLLVNFSIEKQMKKIFAKNINFTKLIIDDITVNEILGSGANAVVYKGFDNFFERNVAIKVWIPNYKNGNKKSNKTRFKEEVKKMANINEMAVTTLYNKGEICSFNLVVMELVEGITLKKWLSKHPNFYKRYTVLRKILETIESVHKQDVFHGDLHDSNILISEKCELEKEELVVNIIDFGTSVFSGQNNSHARESRLLAHTCIKLIPEIKELKLLTISNFDILPPKLVPLITRSAAQVIVIERNHYIAEPAVVDLALLVTIFPFFSIRSIEEIIEKYSEKTKLKVNKKVFQNELINNIYNIYAMLSSEQERLPKKITIAEAYKLLQKKITNVYQKEEGYDKLLIVDTYINFKSLLYDNLYTKI